MSSIELIEVAWHYRQRFEFKGASLHRFLYPFDIFHLADFESIVREGERHDISAAIMTMDTRECATGGFVFIDTHRGTRAFYPTRLVVMG